MAKNETKKTKTTNIPDMQWLFYRNIIKAHPDWSKKRAMTVARYAYNSHYGANMAYAKA